MAHKIVTGLRGRCPGCGEGRLYRKYMEVQPCERCGVDLSRSNLGDGLSTVLFLLIGAFGCFGIIWSELTFNPPVWLLVIVWLPLIGVLCVVAQPPFKSLMLALLHRTEAGEAVTRPHASSSE